MHLIAYKMIGQRFQAQAPRTPINCEHFQCEYSCVEVSDNLVQGFTYLHLMFALHCWFSVDLCIAYGISKLHRVFTLHQTLRQEMGR